MDRSKADFELATSPSESRIWNPSIKFIIYLNIIFQSRLQLLEVQRIFPGNWSFLISGNLSSPKNVSFPFISSKISIESSEKKLFFNSLLTSYILNEYCPIFKFRLTCLEKHSPYIMLSLSNGIIFLSTHKHSRYMQVQAYLRKTYAEIRLIFPFGYSRTRDL